MDMDIKGEELKSFLFDLVRVTGFAYSLVLVQIVLVLCGCCIYSFMRILRTRMKTRFASSSKTIKTMIVLGSGGHTAEIMRVLGFLDKSRYSPRVYVTSSTDVLSGQRALKFEELQCSSNTKPKTRRKSPKKASKQQYLEPDKGNKNAAKVLAIPRSREVGQSYFSSIFTTLYSLVASVLVIIKERPTLLLCNGPGTCLPLCISCRLLQPFSRIVFVESICRTSSLSLTGKILYFLRLADTIFVQWPELGDLYLRVQYSGRVF